MPRWLVPGFILLVLASMVPFAIISRARHDMQRKPRINLIPDMDYQPKYLPQTANPLFADGRAMRPPVEGTVARGELMEDDHFYRGRVNDDWAAAIPGEALAATGSATWADLVARGQNRFNIHCAPCHGSSGDGQGMIAIRGARLMEQGLAVWTPPSSLHTDVVRERSNGYLFNAITNGIRNMPAYGTQISTADRWAVVSYIRALQRSQHATVADVPADARAALE
ncbi:cytochrome c [bacterium]|nr:cytochrome c [bacterium]